MNYLQNLWNALDLGSLRDTLLRVAAVLLCLILHETCHGIAAFFLGDPTAKRNHRLSLNPLRHIDWIGLAAMVLTGVGWAKPVPVNPSYFKHPKRGMAITALAGPVSNLLLALWLLLGARLMYTRALTTGDINETLFEFMVSTALLSIGLGVFNLIPIPPLDGSKVLAALLPALRKLTEGYAALGAAAGQAVCVADALRAVRHAHYHGAGLLRRPVQCVGRRHRLGVPAILPHCRLLLR